MHFDDIVPLVGRPITADAITIAAAGALQNFNLFSVTGSVLIHAIWGEVTVQIGAACTLANLHLWDGAAAVDITDSVGAPPAISLMPVGSMVLRDQVAAQPLAVVDSTAGAMFERAAGSVFCPVGVTQITTDVATYVRFGVTDAGAGAGQLVFRARWAPLSIDGNLEVA